MLLDMAEAGVSEISVQGLTEAIRPFLSGGETDAGQTKDRLGILSCSDKESSQQVGSFLVNILNQALALERGIAQGFDGILGRGKEKADARKQKFAKLQHLVTALTQVTYWPADPKKRAALRGRFGIEGGVYNYNPRSIYPMQIPAQKYNFDQAAYLDLNFFRFVIPATGFPQELADVIFLT